MIRAAENAKSFKQAGKLRNPKSWRAKMAEILPEEWAFDPLEEKVDKNPNNPEAWLALGEEEFERGYFRDALASYEKAIALKSDYALAFLGSAEACFALREYNASVKQSTQAILFDPEIIEAYTMRASAYERLLNYEEAIKDHNVALILKGQPVRAKPKRSLSSELAGKVYLFCVEKIGQPIYRKTESALRSPYVQQKSKAMRAGVIRNFRNVVEKVKSGPRPMRMKNKKQGVRKKK